MNFLEKIIAEKRSEIEKMRLLKPLKEMENDRSFLAGRPSFRAAVASPGPSIIAEFKRRSPSRGVIHETADPAEVACKYEKAGASAVSVLTDGHFGGNAGDLIRVTQKINIPVLRKDFIIDEYQVVEARQSGASAILLIASALSKKELTDLARLAHSLELDVLFEVHHEQELEKCPDGVSIIGVNNRDLETFAVNTEVSLELLEKLPDGNLKISESGISDPLKIRELYGAGFDGFLIGEYFMRNGDPGRQATGFIQELVKQGLKK